MNRSWRERAGCRWVPTSNGSEDGRTPLLDAAARVAEALDVSLDELAGIGPPPRSPSRRKVKGKAAPTWQGRRGGETN